MSHIIAEPCVGVKDAACVDVCPVDCIYGSEDESTDQLFINPEECINCGLCIDACPVEAIFIEEEVPPPDYGESYVERNYRYFDLEPPG